MKKTMRALVAGLCASVAAPAAVAYDLGGDGGTTFSLYGSVRSGVIYNDDGKGETNSKTWDVGTVDAEVGNSSDRLFSRIGVRAAHELENGMIGGLHIEKRLDNFRTRHQNVYLQGDMGRITLGQQSDFFNEGVTADGSNLFGGNIGVPNGTRTTGVRYTSPSAGPFGLSFAFSDSNNSGGAGDDANDRYGIMVKYSHDLVSLSAAYEDYESISPGSMDAAKLAAARAARAVQCGNMAIERCDVSAWGVSANGGFEGFTWDVGYVVRDYADERTTLGVHLGYNTGVVGNVYAQYEDLSTDSGAGEDDWTIFGWSYPVGMSTRIITEHRFTDSDTKRTALALRVDF